MPPAAVTEMKALPPAAVPIFTTAIGVLRPPNVSPAVDRAAAGKSCHAVVEATDLEFTRGRTSRHSG